MQAQAGIGHADEHGVVVGFEPGRADGKAFEVASTESSLEVGLQLSPACQQHGEVGRLPIARAVRRNSRPLGTLECFEQQVEVLVGSPTCRAHDEGDAARAEMMIVRQPLPQLVADFERRFREKRGRAIGKDGGVDLPLAVQPVSQRLGNG